MWTSQPRRRREDRPTKKGTNQEGRGDAPNNRWVDPQPTRGEGPKERGRGEGEGSPQPGREGRDETAQPRRRGEGGDPQLTKGRETTNQQGRGRPFNQEKEGGRPQARREVKTAQPKRWRGGGGGRPALSPPPPSPPPPLTNKGGETAKTRRRSWTAQPKRRRETAQPRRGRGGDLPTTKREEDHQPIREGRRPNPHPPSPPDQQGKGDGPTRKGAGRPQARKGGRPFNQKGRRGDHKQEREVKTAQPKSLRSGGATLPLTTNKGGETSHVEQKEQSLKYFKIFKSLKSLKSFNILFSSFFPLFFLCLFCCFFVFLVFSFYVFFFSSFLFQKKFFFYIVSVHPNKIKLSGLGRHKVKKV